MYARGMTVREIQGHLADLYGLDVSPDLVSAVTEAVLDEIAEWQNRPLEPLYPLVFFDALRVKKFVCYTCDDRVSRSFPARTMSWRRCL